MARPDHDDAPAAPPDVGRIERLDADQWAALLPHARAVLSTMDTARASRDVRRLAAAPTSRLAGGRGRRDLTRLLSTEPGLWEAVSRRITALDDVPETLDWIRSTGQQPSTPVGDDRPGESPRGPSPRDRARLRAAKEARETWRRRAEGAEARAARAERVVADLQDELTSLKDRIDELENQIDAAGQERIRAVDRERRRRDTEVADLREELTSLRRADEERRRQRRLRDAARDQQRAERDTHAEERDEGRDHAVTPGRPTTLPDDVAPGTTEAAAMLLNAGRRVLVDGYNVTMQHRGDLALEQQRTWLIQTLATAAVTKGIRPLVVFDGERPGGFRPPGRDVEVRFTAAGITADDELVLDVEATDDPVVVVTDDRELAARVAVAGADVVGTRSFLGAVR